MPLLDSDGSKISLSAVRRKTYFKRVKKRWKPKDVLEINKSHPKYHFTQYIRISLHKFLSNEKENQTEEADRFHDEDCSEIKEESILCNITNTVVQFQSYAPKVFSYIRYTMGFSYEEYMETLCPSNESDFYLEFISNSKSGQNFFLTRNKQFVIKTITKREAKFLFKILNRYIGHFRSYPHSLLVKFLGLHSIKMKLLQKPVYFIVMISIFYPSERIEKRYDIKACQIGRYTKPASDGKNEFVVLKEKNWAGTKLALGSQRDWFLKQVKFDTDFLRSIGVLDYSLLVGTQPLDSQEKKSTLSLSSVVSRAAKSVWKGRSVGTLPSLSSHNLSLGGVSNVPSMESVTPLPGMVVPNGSEHPRSSVEADTGEVQSTHHLSVATTPSPSHHSQHSPKRFSGASRIAPEPSSPLTKFGDIFGRRNRILSCSERIAENRRLLPECGNELHVIDGEERYYIGIIDFFTRYTLKKRLENAYKRVLYPPLSFSTVAPDVFADRFCRFWVDNTI